MMTKRELIKQFVSERPNQVLLTGIGFWIWGSIFSSPLLFGTGSILVAMAYILLIASIWHPVGRLQTWYEERKLTKERVK